MRIDRYLYEIVEDYKRAKDGKGRDEAFNSMRDAIWSCGNRRRVYEKAIRFNVRNDLLATEIGQIFSAWSEIGYMGCKSMTGNTSWEYLVRQKINNLYTKYFDRQVILNKRYMDLLNVPKRLYYQWINGREFDPDELTVAIDDAISDAQEMKEALQKQKIDMPWGEYKEIVNAFLLKTLKRCKLVNEFESGDSIVHFSDAVNEDNFYIRYFCKCLDGEMLKWQKRYYGVREHKRYKRCESCGRLIEVRSKLSYRKRYCDDCRKDEELKKYKRYNRKRQITTNPKC